MKKIKKIISIGSNFNRILRNKLNSILGKSIFLDLPSHIAIPLVAQCNRRCGFCEIIGVEKKIKSSDKCYQNNAMTIEDVAKFKTFIKNANSVDFGGMTGLGEPFLSPIFEDVISYIKSINSSIHVYITTNALLMNKKISDCILNSGLKVSITFSLHAISEDVFMKCMGSGRSIALENIVRFCDSVKDNDLIDTSINFGIGKYNYSDSKNVLDFAKRNKIDSVNMYLYYKSANNFDEDFSLYEKPEFANNVLDETYLYAERIGQKIIPSAPNYIGNKLKLSDNSKGRCGDMYHNWIMKSDPFNKKVITLGVCNRIIPFQIMLDKKIDRSDLDWAWNHPVLNRFRTDQKNVEICKFCKMKDIGKIRSSEYEKYKQLRDKAVMETLSGYTERVSPNKSIALLDKNVYSI